MSEMRETTTRASVTVTLKHRVTGRLVTVVGHHQSEKRQRGNVREALLDALTRVPDQGHGWKLVAYSNPTTIYEDLQGKHNSFRRRVEETAAHHVRRPDLVAP